MQTVFAEKTEDRSLDDNRHIGELFFIRMYWEKGRIPSGNILYWKDAKREDAQINFTGFDGLLLYLDEIQYLNKKQQQSLLEYIENGQITLIASTTENPYFAVYNALISRSTVFEFRPVSPAALERAVLRGFHCMEEELQQKIQLEEGVSAYIARGCGGDVRKALNTVCLLYTSPSPRDRG